MKLTYLLIFLALNVALEPASAQLPIPLLAANGLIRQLPYLLGVLGTGPGRPPQVFFEVFLTGIVKGILLQLGVISAPSPREAINITCTSRLGISTRIYGEAPYADGLLFLDFTKPTIVLIHGYSDDYTNQQGFLQLGTEAILEFTDYNVCTMDWSVWSNFDYFTVATRFVPQAGTYLANALAFLVSQGLDLDTLHLAGHSLGAHVAGKAGQLFLGQIGQITGLDVAGPLYSLPVPLIQEQLDVTDAKHVTAIMATSGTLGSLTPSAHTIFYRNLDLVLQAGCPIASPVCSHYSQNYDFVAAMDPSKIFIGVECTRLGAPLGYYGTKTSRMGIYSGNELGEYCYRTTNAYPSEPYYEGAPILPLEIPSFP